MKYLSNKAKHHISLVNKPVYHKIILVKSVMVQHQLFDLHIRKICKSLECSIDELFVSDDPQIQRLLAYAHKFNDLNYKDKSDTE